MILNFEEYGWEWYGDSHETSIMFKDFEFQQNQRSSKNVYKISINISNEKKEKLGRHAFSIIINSWTMLFRRSKEDGKTTNHTWDGLYPRQQFKSSKSSVK